jgi:hypothetical protein
MTEGAQWFMAGREVNLSKAIRTASVLLQPDLGNLSLATASATSSGVIGLSEFTFASYKADFFPAGY